MITVNFAVGLYTYRIWALDLGSEPKEQPVDRRKNPFSGLNRTEEKQAYSSRSKSTPFTGSAIKPAVYSSTSTLFENAYKNYQNQKFVR